MGGLFPFKTLPFTALLHGPGLLSLPLTSSCDTSLGVVPLPSISPDSQCPGQDGNAGPLTQKLLRMSRGDKRALNRHRATVKPDPPLFIPNPEQGCQPSPSKSCPVDGSASPLITSKPWLPLALRTLTTVGPTSLYPTTCPHVPGSGPSLSCSALVDCPSLSPPSVQGRPCIVWLEVTYCQRVSCSNHHKSCGAKRGHHQVHS